MLNCMMDKNKTKLIMGLIVESLREGLCMSRYALAKESGVDSSWLRRFEQGKAFTLVGVDEEGVIEQIDGVIGFEGHLYLVEMKWWKDPVGVGEIAQPLVKLFERADARGIIISASNFTEPAISQCRGFLDKKVIILSSLEEIVRLLNDGRDLKDFLSQKIHSATLDMNPWFRI
ncbi:MAG: hypothetical protein DELT_02232 [Desulfovibrio sp.]